MKKRILLAALLFTSTPAAAQCYQNGIPCGTPPVTNSDGTPNTSGSTTVKGSDGVESTTILTDSNGRIITNVNSLPPLAAGSNTIGGVTQVGAPWSTTISGPLPAFAATPTFNIGTINGIATDASLETLFKAGQLIGNTTFASTIAAGADVDQAAIRGVLPPGRGQQTSANSLAVVLSSDNTVAKTSDITTMQTQLHNDLIAPGVLYRATAFNETSTPVGASVSATGASRDSGAAGAQTQYLTFSCFARTDVSGTLIQQGSNDGITWYTELSGTISANVSTTTTGRIFTRYHRCVVTNGSTAQGSLIMNSQLGG